MKAGFLVGSGGEGGGWRRTSLPKPGSTSTYVCVSVHVCECACAHLYVCVCVHMHVCECACAWHDHEDHCTYSTPTYTLSTKCNAVFLGGYKTHL